MCIQIYNNYKERKNTTCFCQKKSKMNFLIVYMFFLMINFVKFYKMYPDFCL